MPLSPKNERRGAFGGWLCYREKMPTPDDIPETVDFKWIARHILALHGDVRALRDEVDVMAAILRRVDNNQTSYRDELRALFDLHRNLRGRVENIERGPPAS